MNNLVINGLDDQTIFLVWEKISKMPNYGRFLDWQIYKNLFYFFVNPLQSNEPLITLFVSKFLSLSVIGNFNVFLIITLLLNLGISYQYFKKYKFGLFYSLMFCFSAYFWSHFGIHVSLMQIWLIPLVFLFRDKKEVFFLAMAVLVSNYLGLFVLITFCLKALIESFWDFKKAINSFKHIFFASILILIVLFPYIKLNYFESASEQNARSVHFDTTPDVNIYAKPSRNMADFIKFSSRPWYFVTPPVKNPILGSFSQNILEKIRLSNKFLTNEYFAGEHQANYLGLVLLGVYFVYVFKALRDVNFQNKKEIIQRFMLLGALFILMLPPFFTIKGNVIYTPSILFFQIFPMFRVTARFSIIILFLILDGLAYLLNIYLAKNIKSYIFIGFLTIITLIEVFIPLKFVKMPQNMPAFEYLATKPASTTFAIYPYSKTEDALYYLSVHKQFLVNPRGYVFGGFDSENFTKNIKSSYGKYDYLLINKTESILPINNWILEKEFSDYYIYKAR